MYFFSYLARSMHGEMLRRMAKGDRDRQKIKHDKEAAAKVKCNNMDNYETIVILIVL